ncbi:inositol monophosphatase [Mangrovibacter phragmitis]|uniref:Nus factor SuhB n=1 Tax=Mangrovibacter phragmitis TaxID=1691903 RepID=A0A1B7KZD7_9ENTR|nr:inositol monophosphatase [Mangrovibacter phragmitis]OAT75416.1 inositol monophosphatase [Mangrovibacter phragmitis]
MTTDQKQALFTLIKHAGQHAQALRNQGLKIDSKGQQDFVSEADIWVEQQLRHWLAQHFPTDGFLGEESGLQTGNGRTWVIDPIDGTTNYISGMDYWCISVACVEGEQVVLGIIYAPDRNEFFVAEAGKGATLNGHPLHLREPNPEQVVIGLGRSSRTSLDGYLKTLQHLADQGVEYRRFGAGALMLAHVAAGQVHGYFEAHLNSWDALAGLLLILEAGGQANPFLAHNGLIQGNVMWAATPRVWQRLSPLLLD